jgi:hypothetical protein
MWTRGRGHLKISKDPTGNQTWDFPLFWGAQCLSIFSRLVTVVLSELQYSYQMVLFLSSVSLPSLKYKIMTYAVTLD